MATLRSAQSIGCFECAADCSATCFLLSFPRPARLPIAFYVCRTLELGYPPPFMTNSLNIQTIVQEFIDRLKDALADEVSTAIRATLSGSTGGGDSGTASSKRRGTGRPPSTTASAARNGRAKGAKRSPEEFEALTKAFLGYVKKNPGQRVEQIGKAIGISTKELALPVQKLLREKAISKKGQRRATTYSAR